LSQDSGFRRNDKSRLSELSEETVRFFSRFAPSEWQSILSSWALRLTQGKLCRRMTVTLR